MAWRKTGEFSKPREISVQTCDQCGGDIGTPDGYGSKYPYFEIIANKGAPVCDDDGSMSTYVLCSALCLTAMASRLAAGERVPESRP